MVKKRSAISKSMSKKPKEPSQRVSGLSSSKPSSKRKEAPVKFGSLSRKQKQDLLDYGELVPRDFEHNEEEIVAEEEEEGKKQKNRRVIVEDDLDREIEEEKQRELRQFDSESDAEIDQDDEDWEKPSAYSLLLGSLKKTSKNQDFHKKIQREQEGLDALEDESEEDGSLEDSDNDVEDTEIANETEVDGDNVQLDQNMSEDNITDDDEDDEKSEEEEGEEEEEIGYISSDNEEEMKHDIYESRLTDQQPKEFDEKIALVEEKKWSSQAFEDDVLMNVLCYTTSPDKAIEKHQPIKSLDQVGVKERVARYWNETNKSCVAKETLFTPLQERLFNHISNYRDIMYCNRSIENAKEIRHIYALHALNHITKARNRVLKNTARISKAHKENKEPADYRDQGFTRPRVLIVLPFRNSVVDVVDALIKLSGTEQQENKKRFYKEFNLLESDSMDEDKPADFNDTFRGNIDDHFRLAIKFNKKTMKFYSSFYGADIVIASPLGLRTIIGSESDGKRDFDFLSSLELVILDQSNHILMQNWEHIEHLFKHINLIPSDTHGCDISRIKSWHLDGKARYLRQTMIFSDFLFPEMNALFAKHMKNVSGKLKITQNYEGAILDVIPQIQQRFTRFDSPSLISVNDARFKFFIEQTLPSLRKSAITQSHTLLFIPSYFDFVRVRNYLEDNKYSFQPCCEYTTPSGIARARTQFFHGRTNFILYTERLHFYRRFNIRGAFHAVFYGLPDHPQFYADVVNFLGLKFNDASAAEEATFSCTALFSKYDLLKLERIVGTDRAKKMCKEQKNIFMFA